MERTITTHYNTEMTKEITRLIEGLNLPLDLLEDALKIAKELSSMGLTKRGYLTVTAATAIYIACKKRGIPITLRDFLKSSLLKDIEKPRLVAFYKRFAYRSKMHLGDVEPYIIKIVDALKLDKSIANDALKILKKIRRKRITEGKSLLGLAGALVYIAAQNKGEKVTQKRIAQAAHVTEVTIRTRYKEIQNKLRK